ncbi:hypothetical protein ACFFLS_24155 [Flavobacterium procerum]|uniref:Uncharacterized protein n=1 Tax=Flavobacterium procerum TaxID=1455569 RepID=A0ABV6BXK6_9FLAO
MITFQIREKLKTKPYLKNFTVYTFPSFIHLILELFEKHEHGHKQIFEIELLLEELGYSNLKEIKKSEIDSVKNLIISKLEEWELNDDSEILAYKLLAAIKNKNLTVYIDNQIIQDLEMPISITPESVIAFINNSKLNSISFKTL